MTDTNQERAKFAREERYVVFKIKRLDAEQLSRLSTLLNESGPGFKALAPATVDCLVIESDWPEYQIAWQMIEDRVMGKQAASGAVPEGYALVPIQPTEQMQAAAKAADETGYGDVYAKMYAAMLAAAPHPVSGEQFQARVLPWLLECFGQVIADDKVERNHRFLEEALELVQACGCTEDEAHKLVAYVYGRALGERSQEVGGVMVTLAALCLAQGLDMHQCGEAELSRITQPAMVEKIREKQKRKPAMSPLPGLYGDRVQFTEPPAAQDVSGLVEAAQAFADAARPNIYPCPDKPLSLFGKLQALDEALAAHRAKAQGGGA